jgi:Ca-activated chloride channel family protein
MPVASAKTKTKPQAPPAGGVGGPGKPGAGAGFGGGNFSGGFGGGGFNGGSGGMPAVGLTQNAGARPQSVAQYAQAVNGAPGGQSIGRMRFETGKYAALPAGAEKGDADGTRTLLQARDKWHAYEQARGALAKRRQDEVQTGKLGVDLSVQTFYLRNQSQLEFAALRQVNGRNCMEVGGVWIDEGFTARTPTLVVKAQSAAYFRILELQPKVKEVFQLGNYLVWVTPSGTALIVDTSEGKEKMSVEEIGKRFVALK